MNRQLIVISLAGLIAVGGALLFVLLATTEPAPAPPSAAASSAPERVVHKGGPELPHAPREPLPTPQPPSEGEPGSVGPEGDDYGKPSPLGMPGGARPDEGEDQDHDDPAEADPTVWPASADGIQGAIGESLPKIRRCYERALEQHPDMGGSITVSFTIGTRDTAAGVGTVLDAGIADATIEQETMDDCLLDAMEDLQFDPPADGEMTIRYPFRFSTE